MTQVTRLIIRPSQDQARNLVLAIIDVARKQPASHETLTHIRTLAAEAIDLMGCPPSEGVAPATSGRQVTISKRDYRQICNAYINSVNAKQQLLMVHRGDNPFSDAAVGRLEDAFHVIIQQLKEVVDGDSEGRHTPT